MKDFKLLWICLSLAMFFILLSGCSSFVRDVQETDSGVVTDSVTLLLDIEGIGSVIPEADSEHSYERDTIVNIQADPGFGYSFERWRGDVAHPGNSRTTIVMSEDKQLTAVFKELADFFVENEFVVVDGGTSAGYLDLEDITIAYDLEVSRYLVTNAEFLEFLNDSQVSADGSYQGKSLIAIGSADTQIGHDGQQFILIDWEDPDGIKIDVANYPVVMVSWYGAVAYSNWLSQKEGSSVAYDNWQLREDDKADIAGYRLPSVDEWDYLARGGKDGLPTLYAGSDDIEEVGWYWGNSQTMGNSGFQQDGVNIRGTMPVGQKEGNELEIHDMSGNVWELTGTILDDDTGRVKLRGGSWENGEFYCRIGIGIPQYTFTTTSRAGFRLVRTN